MLVKVHTEREDSSKMMILRCTSDSQRVVITLDSNRQGRKFMIMIRLSSVMLIHLVLSHLLT